MRYFLLSGLILFSTLVQGIDLLGGSDGPTPFTKVAPPGLISVPTEFPISSFTVLEKSNELAYVDNEKNLRLHNLENGKERTLGNFLEKLLPFTDHKEKFLLSDSKRILKNIENYSNDREIQLPMASRFLFWEKDELYLMKKLEQVGKLEWKLDYYLFRTEKNLVEHKSCSFFLSEPRKRIELGDGHRFPNLLLYSPPSLNREKGLMFYYLDLRAKNEACSLKSLPETTDFIWGEIQSISQVSPYHDMVVITDHSDWNIYFGKPGKWRYASLPGGSSYLPNPKVPMVINLNRQQGVSIYSLKTQKYFNLDFSVDREMTEQDQVWVTTNGDKLYINAKEDSGNNSGRSLFELDLKKLKSND